MCWDRLYPGLVINDKPLAERYQPLWRSLWADETPRRLLILYPDPRDLRSTDVETLCQRFRTAGFWMTRPYAAKILAAVQALPLPDAELGARRSTFLQRDLANGGGCRTTVGRSGRRNGRPVGSYLGLLVTPQRRRTTAVSVSGGHSG